MSETNEYLGYDLPEFEMAIDKYRNRFDSLPDLLNIRGHYVEARKALESAVARNEPYTEDQWYKAIGMEPPPSGEDILT